MKRVLLIFVSAIIMVTISAQQAQKAVVSKTSVKLASSADTLQYTLGAFVGQWLAKNGFVINNPVLFKVGMDDVLEHKTLLVADSSINKRISEYQLAISTERSRQQEEQLFAYLRGKPGVGVLPDGVNYVILKTGTGDRPSAKDSVVVNFVGTFADGNVFENTYKDKKPVTTLTGTLIPGLNEAVQLMPAGSQWRIFIPSALAYGSKGYLNIIAPNTALIFELTLEEVKKGAK